MPPTGENGVTTLKFNGYSMAFTLIGGIFMSLLQKKIIVIDTQQNLSCHLFARA